MNIDKQKMAALTEEEKKEYREMLRLHLEARLRERDKDKILTEEEIQKVVSVTVGEKTSDDDIKEKDEILAKID